MFGLAFRGTVAAMSILDDIADPERSPPRYTTRPFPPYRYVPGAHPHPTRDPRGHSYDPQPTLNRHAPWRPEDWRLLDDWLYGIDLFNAHYFWEAHEAWEGLWAAVPRESVAALFLQGLIQLAAALLKRHMGSEHGAVVLSGEGLDKLRHVAAAAPQFMGLDVENVAAAFATFFRSRSSGGQAPAGDVPVLRLLGIGERTP